LALLGVATDLDDVSYLSRMASTIGEILPEAARRFGDNTALIVQDEAFSFSELESMSNRVANGLVSVGVVPGDRVTLYGANCWEWIVAYYAIAKAGAVVNPISSMLTAEEVRYVVADAGARVVVASVDKGTPVLDLVGTAELSSVVLWGDDVPAAATSFSEWLTEADSEFARLHREPGELAAICYTSGTTGHPKGAMQSHRAVITAAVGTVLMGARGPTDRVLNSLPLAHVYGSCVFNAAMMAGSTLIMVPRFNEEAVLMAIAEHKATLMDGVPTVYYYLLAHPDFDKADLSSLTRCWVGGQTLPSAKAIEFTERTGCPIHEVWGMTELAGAASANPVVGPNKPGTIGIAYPGNQMRIVDLDDPGLVLGPGERGELMFRGPMVMDGYYGNADATRASIEPDGWLHSGDIATVDEDGYFTIVDRKTDMILTAGFNVYPAEVERVLCMHPAVALAAVTGVADEVKGELAKAYVVLKPGATATTEALVAHCREHLAAYKLPRAVQFVDEVPITASGKIMRRLLKDYDDGTR
jgi:long-chain acyl-CoA synthetase